MQETLKCSNLVVKVASRCNLNCSYCYMYNAGDTTYKIQPKLMSDKVVDALLEKVHQHCISNQINTFTFVFHGGEPLLAPPAFYTSFVEKARMVLENVEPVFKMQTNGTLLTEEWLRLFHRLDISFGISLDGTKSMNDQYRLDHAGRSSYDKVVEGFRLAQHSPYSIQMPGIASYINVENDPLEVYEHFKSLQTGYIDFIFPDVTYDARSSVIRDEDTTPYANWLIAIFDRWFTEGKGKPRIRLFEIILMLILGREMEGGYDAIGSGKHEVLVIETNGNIEPIDSLKVCGDGFTKVGANVLTHNIDEALDKKLSVLNNLSHRMLCKQCMACPLKEVCGGGYLSHRYSSKNGFNNPSLYCRDIIRLVAHLQNAMLKEVPLHLQEQLEIRQVTYHEILKEIEENMAVSEEPEWAEELISFGKEIS